MISYIIDRNINYTNVCKEFCTFCAFYRVKGDAEAYVLPDHVIYKKIEETLALGGTGILMQGGVHPGSEDRLLREAAVRNQGALQDSLPLLFTSEILNIAKVSRLTVAANFRTPESRGSGFHARRRRRDSRRRDPHRYQSAEVQQRRLAHGSPRSAQAGSANDRHDDDRRRRNDPPSHQSSRKTPRSLQDETGGFTAFIPWTFQPENTELAKRNLPEVTAAEYLRMLALSRIYLDNIDNIQVSWLTVGLKIGQVGLRFGVNDMGSIMIEENVISAAGARNRANDAELRRIIAGCRLHSSPANHPLRTLRQLGHRPGVFQH